MRPELDIVVRTMRTYTEIRGRYPADDVESERATEYMHNSLPASLSPLTQRGEDLNQAF